MTRASHSPVRLLLLVLLGGLAFAPAGRRPAPPGAVLQLEEVGSDPEAWDVIATLISGPSEMIVWDAMARQSDGVALADRIAASGKHLRAILISHPDHDHYMGAAALLDRFPGTPVYMSAPGIEEFQKTSARALEAERRRHADDAPDRLVTPAPFPASRLTLDGETIEIVSGLTGDSGLPINTALWIPSLQTVLVADLAFNGVHPWLGASTEASLKAWLASLDQVRALHPAVVVPGHKQDVGATDSPAVLDFMTGYLTDFTALRQASPDADQLYEAMLAKYPDLVAPGLLRYATRMAYRSPGGGN